MLTGLNLFDILCLCSGLTSDYDESHDVKHHVDVYKNAITIFFLSDVLDTQESDRIYLFKLITLSSLLHDTIDHKYKNNLDAKINKLNLFLIDNYGCEWPDVKWIINNISYSKEVKIGYPLHENRWIRLARDVVSDADKIEALGERGILRCKQFSMATNPTATDSEIIKLVIEHCHEKLLRLKDHFIRTVIGKQMAEPAHQVIVDFVSNHTIS